MAAVEDSTVDMNYQNPNVKVPPLNIAKTVEKSDEEEHPATCMEKAFMFFGFYAGKLNTQQCNNNNEIVMQSND